ncbi:MAG: hypothetical protein ABIP94_13675 [Planctomycetota bacterium]
MHIKRSALAAMLLVVVVPAQAGTAKPAAQVTEYEKLVAEWKAAGDAFTVARKALAETDAYKAAVEAKDSKAQRELMGKLEKPDAKAFGERALKLADQQKGDAAMPFLTFAATELNDEATTKAVVERVLAKHVKSPQLTGLMENAMAIARFVGPEDTDKFLERVIAESPQPVNKGWAMYWQSVTITRNKNASDEDKAKAQQLLADAEKLAAGTDLADRIAGPRFEKESLQIGMEVPNIAGEDVDGVKFNLADYRGKVVVLDFWGFW